MSDPQLREQFNIAREIHRSGKDSREVIVPSEDAAAVARGGRLGRRIATAAIALVALNVAVGILVIAGKNRKPAPLSAQKAAIGRSPTSLSAAESSDPQAFEEAAKNILNRRAVTAGTLDRGGVYVYEGTTLYVGDQFMYGDRGGDTKAWAYLRFDNSAGKLKSQSSARPNVGQTVRAIVTFLEFKEGSTPGGHIGRLAVFQCHAFQVAGGRYVELSPWPGPRCAVVPTR